ncbi:MAG: hypothetical protein COT28_07255, partial [Methylobacterium sp. CG08_land_8_20_14_0_20_71_15]
MARTVGSRIPAPGLLAPAAALVVLAPLAVLWPLPAALGLAAVSGLAALVAHRRASGLAARCDKLSGEIDILSERLLKVEARGAAAATPEAAPPGEAGVEELSVEIGLLSGIVRDLAAVVSAQDGEIAGLKDAQARAQAEAGERAQAQAQSHAALHAAVQAELRARPA